MKQEVIKDLQHNFNEDSQEHLRPILSLYSTKSKFEDNTWYFDKVKKPGQQLSACTAYFSKCPAPFIKILKYFALSLLSDQSYDTVTVCKTTRETNMFLRFLDNNYPKLPLCNVNRAIIFGYVAHLNKTYAYETRIKKYSAISSFFKIMRDFNEMPDVSPMLPDTPFPRLRSNIKKRTKMIPPYVAAKMDSVFKNEEVPLHLRTAYWIMRSFPSRASEITGMPIDCILPAMQPGSYTLKIPTWKQNGGHLEPESRLMEVKNVGHGAYLLHLIRQQQEFSRNQQTLANETDRGLLFLYKVQYMNGPNKFHKNKKTALYERKKPVLLKLPLLRTGFNRICRIFNITDEDGNLYLFTSHQLRHCGITDRVYEGFRLEDIREMTKHKNYEMLVRNYIHEDSEELLKKQDAVFQSVGLNTGKKVFFKGVILSSDDQEKRILNNPKSARIGKIGLCADATECADGPTECLACEYFIPDAEQLDYFEEQVRVWKEKSKLFKKNKIWYEHALHNITAYQGVVNRIRQTLNLQS